MSELRDDSVSFNLVVIIYAFPATILLVLGLTLFSIILTIDYGLIIEFLLIDVLNTLYESLNWDLKPVAEL